MSIFQQALPHVTQPVKPFPIMSYRQAMDEVRLQELLEHVSCMYVCIIDSMVLINLIQDMDLRLSAYVMHTTRNLMYSFYNVYVHVQCILASIQCALYELCMNCVPIHIVQLYLVYMFITVQLTTCNSSHFTLQFTCSFTTWLRNGIPFAVTLKFHRFQNWVDSIVLYSVFLNGR